MIDYLKELGFPFEEYSSNNFRHLEDGLAQFIRKTNEIYKIYPNEDVSADFSILSIHEPWFAGFLKRALDIKRNNKKELS